MPSKETNQVIAAAALRAAQRHITKAMQELADATPKVDPAVGEVLQSFVYQLNQVYEGIENV